MMVGGKRIAFSFFQTLVLFVVLPSWPFQILKFIVSFGKKKVVENIYDYQIKIRKLKKAYKMRSII